MTGKERTRIGLLASLLVAGAPVFAEPLRIGVSAPLSGSSAILGRQVEAGAAAAARSLGDVILEIVDDGCAAEGGSAAAARLAQAQVRVVIGFLCYDAIAAAMPAFKQAAIPVITVGVRTDSLTDGRVKSGWPVFRLGPRADGEQKAVATLLPRLWRNELFAIVDDGTIYGRELAESFRLAAEQAALKPVFVDTYRPQSENQIGLIGRLRRAGATHVFVGGDRDDIAVMARDAAALDTGLVLAGGEALRSAPGDLPLAVGTIMIGLPEAVDLADPGVLARLADEGVLAEGYALPAYAAVEIAKLATGTGGLLRLDALTGRDFKTVLGPVRFEANGDLSNDPYKVFVYDGTRFVPQDRP